MEGKEKQEKEVGRFRLVGGRFNKQGNLHTRFVLSSRKINRTPHSFIVILKSLHGGLNWVLSCTDKMGKILTAKNNKKKCTNNIKKKVEVQKIQRDYFLQLNTNISGNYMK